MRCGGAETAKTCLIAALSGHTVLSTIHGGSIVHAIRNLAALATRNEGIGSIWSRIADSLLAVLHLERSRTRTLPDAKALFLTFDGHEPLRTKIRSGQFDFLAEEADRQETKLRDTRGRSGSSLDPGGRNKP